MCGRYAAGRSPEDLVEEFEVEAAEGDPGGALTMPRNAGRDLGVRALDGGAPCARRGENLRCS